MSELPKIIFKLSGFALLFIFSGIIGYKNLLPYHLLEQNLVSSAETLAQLVLEKPKNVLAKRYENEGVRIVEGKTPFEGLTAIQGWFEDGLAVKLIDLEGNLVHRWPIDFFEIWSNPNPDDFESKDQIPQTRFSFHSQGMHLYPDGSLLYNIGSIALVKVDRCGKVLWTSQHFNHHSVTVDNEGNIWTPAHRKLQEVPEELFFHHFKHISISGKEKNSYENLVVKMDDSGNVIQKISVLEKIIDAGFEDAIYDALLIEANDPLHVNDIEMVNAALAEKLASHGVKEGDLLLSIRQMHMLLIMDRDSGEIRWHRAGPWVRQHDPDVDDEGNITVYNNRSFLLKRSGKDKAYSNILKFYPDSGQVKVIYPEDGFALEDNQRFFADIMGVHQLLANGNILITETRTGRVFEVNEAGELVWEYIENYGKDFAALIESANRYDKDYFQFDSWACPAK